MFKSYYIKWYAFLALIVFYQLDVHSENNLFCHLETVGITGGGKFSPFWHVSNRQGLPSVVRTNGYTHYSVIGDVSSSSGMCVGYGMDIGLGAGLEKECFLHQLYSELEYKSIGLSIGIKERWSDKNWKLSSGALTWSGNSKPIPEIRIGIMNYLRIPMLGSWFSIKGHIGYGRMADDNWRKKHGGDVYADEILFHSKSLFLRFGDETRFPLQVTLGLEMNNMFGGVKHYGDEKRIMPSDLDTYWKVLFPFHKVGKQGNEDGDNLGSWHLNFDYKIKDWHIDAYYEHFYEDHSSMLGIEYKKDMQGEKNFIFYGFRHNWFDGLFGIEVDAPDDLVFLHSVVLEYMNTKGQSGPVCNFGPLNEGVDGRDDMYNHSFYDSYTHYGYAIGNPVLISPAYNSSTSNRFRSNRVQMFHFGIEGGITKGLDYRALATTTRHWGQYGAPLKEVERVTSVMLECSYKFGGEYGWRVSLSGAADFDSGSDGAYLLGNNRGVMLTISKSWKVL